MHSSPVFMKTLLASITSWMLFTACIKGPDITLPDFDLPEHHMNAQQALSTLQNLIHEAVELSDDLADHNGVLTLSQCPEIKITKAAQNTTYPLKITINADKGCQWRGHTIAGSAEFTLDKSISSGGAALVGKVQQFSIDNAQLNGDLEGKFGPADKPQSDVRFTFTNFQVITQKGKTLHFANLTAQRLQTAGQLTVVKKDGKPALEDDVFTLQIAGNGKTAEGVTFTVSTETPVTRTMTCRWIALGKIVIKTGPVNNYIDFGNGACDNEATLKVGSEVKTVQLGR